MPTKSLISESTVLEPNGSGWSCNYEACLYRLPQNLYPMSLVYHHGFLLCVRIFHICNALYLDNQLASFDPDPDSDPNSLKYYKHLPPSIPSSSNPILNSAVDTVLADFGVPTSDRDSLARLLFDMIQSDHEAEMSTRECVPLVLDFYKTIVLRNEAEAADWVCGGRMDSVIVNTLRATHDTVSELGMTSFDGSSSKTESCMVCLEGFEDGERLNCLPCSHEFHHNCIVKWLGCNHCCPLCRFSMDWVHTSTD